MYTLVGNKSIPPLPNIVAISDNENALIKTGEHVY